VVSPEDKGPLTVKLVPAGALTGRLVTPQGRPLPDLEIASLFADPPGGPGGGPPDGSFPPGVRSGKDGQFRIAGLAPGLKYRFAVLVGASLRDPVIGQPPMVKPGETKDLGNVLVNPGE
jgi:hypothetical protein